MAWVKILSKDLTAESGENYESPQSRQSISGQEFDLRVLPNSNEGR